jgi:hypothetical protein
MKYRRAGNLCAVSIGALKLPIPPEQALRILQSLPGLTLIRSGFGPQCLDMVRDLIGVAAYRRKALMRDAPERFDCSGLAKWFYGQLGIELPRRSLQQFEDCGEFISPFAADFRPGDLLFARGMGHSYYRKDPSFSVGHVAIVSGPNTAISAVPGLGVVEQDMSDLRRDRFRGVRRIVPNPDDFYVFEIGPDCEIMCSDDLFFIVVDTFK